MGFDSVDVSKPSVLFVILFCVNVKDICLCFTCVSTGETLHIYVFLH